MANGQVVHIISSSFNPQINSVSYAVKTTTNEIFVAPAQSIQAIPSLPNHHHPTVPILPNPRTAIVTNAPTILPLADLKNLHPIIIILRHLPNQSPPSRNLLRRCLKFPLMMIVPFNPLSKLIKHRRSHPLLSLALCVGNLRPKLPNLKLKNKSLTRKSRSSKTKLASFNLHQITASDTSPEHMGE